MRSWVYNRIIAVALPGGMAEKVISSGSADNPEPPFIVLQMGTEQPPLGMTAESRTQEIPFTVWIHDRPGTMVDNIDEGARLLKDALPAAAPAVAGGMSIYECRWTDTGADAYDDHYNTNTRPVNFMMVTRR